MPAFLPRLASAERLAGIIAYGDFACRRRAPTHASGNSCLHAPSTAVGKKIRQPQILDMVSHPIQLRMMNISAGVATLGLPRNDAEVFGWDNEYERQEVSVPAFKIDEHMVTNAQFLQFLDAGGYDERDLWSPADWDWKTAHGIRHPAFWKQVQSRWHYCGMFDEVMLPGNWPVYVSHAEASAYARWAEEGPSHGSAMASRGIRRSGRFRKTLPLGRRIACFRLRQFRFSAVGPGAGQCIPG